MVAIANENVANSIDSDIVDDSPDDWLDLESNFDLDADGVFYNNEAMTYTGDLFDEEYNDNSLQPPDVLSTPDTVPSIHP